MTTKRMKNTTPSPMGWYPLDLHSNASHRGIYVGFYPVFHSYIDVKYITSKTYTINDDIDNRGLSYPLLGHFEDDSKISGTLIHTLQSMIFLQAWYKLDLNVPCNRG